MYTLAIDDVLEVPVSLTLKSGAVAKLFKFTLTAKRLTSEEIRERVEDKTRSILDILREVVTGWSGQRLVLEQDGRQSAEFSPEALEAMMNVAGVALVMYQAWFKECGAAAKN